MNWPSTALSHLRDCVTTAKPGVWMAACPVHKQGQERRRSMRVRLGDTGVLLLRCFVCRERGQDFLRLVCQATGTVPAQWCRDGDHTQFRRPRTMAKILATYDYVDEHGELLMQVCRLDGNIKCQCRRPARQNDPPANVREDHTGRWVWESTGAGSGQPCALMYRVTDLIESDPESPVCICEGEKDCDTLAALGLTAVTNPFGAGNWNQAHADRLTGRRCVIFEDNDQAGRNRTAYVAGTLVVAGASSIRVVRFTDLPEHGDVTDWLNAPAMQALADDEMKLAEIATRVRGACEWQPLRNAS